MANEEHLMILRSGTRVWNRWREENPEVRVDLHCANLEGANLFEANLSTASLSSAHFEGANLFEANLVGANLLLADLSGAALIRARLDGAQLELANLPGARLGGAHLGGASLVRASLHVADLTSAHLEGADLSEAACYFTAFANIDLSEAKNLETILHEGPSPISTSTLEKSRGQIPDAFLKGCGLQDWEILAAKLYDPDLSASEVTDITYEITNLRTRGPILISPLFISYSHADTAFVEATEKLLDKKGIRYWRDVHHATSGRLEKVIDRAMELNPTVLLVLSENSVESDWVEWEARKARQLEKKLERDVLCPVALDDTWKKCRWPERLRDQIAEYNVLDFSRWEEKPEMDKMFPRLLKGLGAFYGPGAK